MNSCFPEQYCYQTQQFIGICFFPFCVTYEHGLISMLSRTSKGHFLKKIVSFRPRELEMLKASGIRGKKATVHKHNIMIKGILLRMRLCLVVNHELSGRVSATIYGLAFPQTNYSKCKVN